MIDSRTGKIDLAGCTAIVDRGARRRGSDRLASRLRWRSFHGGLEIDLFREVPTLTLRQAVRCTRLKLFCEESGRMVTFAEARR